jgi:short-subunit dehydrogenase
MSSQEVAKIGLKALKQKKRLVVPGVMNKVLVISLRIIPRSFAIWSAKYFNIKLVAKA